MATTVLVWVAVAVVIVAGGITVWEICLEDREAVDAARKEGAAVNKQCEVEKVPVHEGLSDAAAKPSE